MTSFPDPDAVFGRTVQSNASEGFTELSVGVLEITQTHIHIHTQPYLSSMAGTAHGGGLEGRHATVS